MKKTSKKKLFILAIIGAITTVLIFVKKGKIKIPFLQKLVGGSRVSTPGTVLKDGRGVTFEFMSSPAENGANILVNGRPYGTLSEMWLEGGTVYGLQAGGNKYMFNGSWTGI